MKKTYSLLMALLVALLCPRAGATQADDTTITITAQNPGATPFINQLSLMVSDTSVIKNIQFTITPKTGSVTRPLSGTFSQSYLIERGYIVPGSEEVFLPVYGLYADYANTVSLSYQFLDGSTKEDSVTIITAPFDDPCGYDEPIVLQARTESTALSYDFFMVSGSCSTFSPGILDTDSEIRWVGTGGISDVNSILFDNAVYQAADTAIYRLDLDGTVTLVRDYADVDIHGLVTEIHHTIDRGKSGLILQVATTNQLESTFAEIDLAGNVLKSWDLAEILSAAMTAGGDDPSQFVLPGRVDWFHSNSTTYDRANDTLIISSRENFVIGLDYETGAIKWILGDSTKNWHQFPSLTQYELALGPDTLPPIGQHSVSTTFDQDLLLLDNGFFSQLQMPPGVNRGYTSPRKYHLDFTTMEATEVWNYEIEQSVNSPICGVVREDAPLNYLVNYAFENGFGASANYARLLGLDAAGSKVFDYRYPTSVCAEIFSSMPLHLESTKFPSVRSKPLNISTRGMVGVDDDVLIGGFIVTGSDSEIVALRALGPSLSDSGVTDTLADPVLTLYDSSGAVIANNDSWESSPSAPLLAANGLAPGDPAEAAAIQTLAPGAYTFVVKGKDASQGIGLVEAYDLSSTADSKLANISTRGSVGTGESVLISGFIIGDVDSATVVVRAIGPSLSSAGIDTALDDPMLTVFDSNGATLVTNDNWQDDATSLQVEENGLAPGDEAESATLLNLPAGAYTAIVSGTGETTGIGLVEVYNLE